MNAVIRGDENEVKNLLCCEGIDVHSRVEEHRITPFSMACGKGYAGIVKMFLGQGENSYDMNYGFICSLSNDHLQVVKLLTDGWTDPSTHNNWAIGFCSGEGLTDIVEFLLKDPRVNPADQENYSVCQASRRGQEQVLKLLLADPRVDAMARDNYAVRYGLACSIKILLEDERFGIHVNREIFEEHHPSIVKKYDKLTKERDAKKWTAVWCMKEIGMGWTDIMCPFGDRFDRLELDL